MEVLTKPTVSVTNDFFFKFSLSGEDDISKELRETMIYEFTGIQCKESTVLNSEFPTNPLSEKAIYVDVLVKDKNNNMFNIEMQAYNTGYEYLRFQYYTIRIASAQIKTGEEYYKLKPIHQVIFYNRNPEGKQKLIKHFSLSINYGEQIPQNIPNIIVIYIPMIQKVVNDKGFDYLNDIEKYCYLLYNGSIDKQDNSNYGKLVELTMKKYDEFKKREELFTLAEQREQWQIRYRSEMGAMEMQGIEQGLEQGRILGIKEEKIRSLKKLLLLRYHEVNDLWIESLNENQLDQFQELLFEIEDYQEFYDRINQIK